LKKKRRKQWRKLGAGAADNAEELVGDEPTVGVLSKVEDIVELEGVGLLIQVALTIDNDQHTTGQGGVAVNILRLEVALLEGHGAHLGHNSGVALHLLASPSHQGGGAVDASELGAVRAEDLIVLGGETLTDLIEGHG